MAVLGIVVQLDGSAPGALPLLSSVAGLRVTGANGARVAAVLMTSDAEARPVLESIQALPGVVGVWPVFHALDEVTP